MSKLRGVLIFVGLIVGLVLVIRYMDRAVAVNQTTKTCLITGASSGIGRHLAIEMVKRGWTVIGVARRSELLDTLSKQLGNMFIPLVCDVSDLKQVHTTSNKIKELGLKPTLFFLNAGTGELQPKWQFSVASHQRTFATNYFGAIAWIEEWLLPVKQLGGGTFVAISSIAALLATPGSDAYATSKRALVHCFDALRRQYLHDNIGFIVVLPGPVDTDMLKGESVKKLPFIHQASDEAKYIIEGVFKREKQIEPSWLYSLLFRLLNWLPDNMMLKLTARQINEKPLELFDWKGKQYAEVEMRH